jgi:GNAT superfamily N-acetyltransferase
MIKAAAEDKPLILDILSKSFDNNRSVNYIIKSGNSHKKCIHALMDYSFEICNLFGEVFLSDDRSACVLILYPHRKSFLLKTIWLDIKLIFNAVGLSGVAKVMKREAQIKKIQPKEDMAYLWFIGVDPAKQHMGIGSKLLSEIITYTTRKQLSVYLETSTPENLSWYKRFGFEIYDRLLLGYTLFFFKRNPN